MLQLTAQSERTIQQIRKLPLLAAHWKQLARGNMLSCDRQSRNLTLDERQLQTADARSLSGAVNVRNRRLLKRIHFNAAHLNRTSQQLRKLDIRHEMKTAREIITLNSPTLRTAN
jgi:hypothetical protein